MTISCDQSQSPLLPALRTLQLILLFQSVKKLAAGQQRRHLEAAGLDGCSDGSGGACEGHQRAAGHTAGVRGAAGSDACPHASAWPAQLGAMDPVHRCSSLRSRPRGPAGARAPAGSRPLRQLCGRAPGGPGRAGARQADGTAPRPRAHPVPPATLRREEHEGALEFDLGNLAAFDPSPLDAATFQGDTGAACHRLATRIMQVRWAGSLGALYAPVLQHGKGGS